MLHQLRLLLPDRLHQSLRLAVFAESEQLDQVRLGSGAQAPQESEKSVARTSPPQLHFHIPEGPELQSAQQSAGLPDIHFRSSQEHGSRAGVHPGASELKGRPGQHRAAGVRLFAIAHPLELPGRWQVSLGDGGSCGWSGW